MFYRLFLKITAILFLAIFCKAEIKAVLPEQEQAGLKTSPKQILIDSEYGPDFWAAVSAIEEESLRAHPKPGEYHPSKRQKVSEGDSEFLAAVGAIEKEYLSQNSLSSSATDRQSQNSQLPSSALASDIQTPKASQIEDLFYGFSYNHLKTPEDHQQHLINAINSAKRSILITSYTFSADMREESHLFKTVETAISRGVKLYFYANTIKLERSILDSLSRLRKLKFVKATVHSKLLVVDKKQITCGSYDWLSHPCHDKDQNTSLILEGGELNPAIEHIWQVLKKYRNVDLNSHSLRQVEKDLRRLPPIAFQFSNPDDFIEVLSTPYQHQDVFEGCFQLARHQITFCAPFIKGNEMFLEKILPARKLVTFLRSGKKLNIFYRAEEKKINVLKRYMDQFLSPNLKENVTLTPINGLHRKSLFVDEDQYIEGSYNWLSSARSLEDPYYYMETSLRFTGTWARELIREFYSSDFIH